MILKRVKVNAGMIMGINCYVIQDEESKETMIIDPGNTTENLTELLDAMQIKLKYILLTHCHGDHIAGVAKLKEKYGGQILIHRKDAEGLKNVDVNLSTYIGLEPINLQEDARIDGDDILHIGDMEFKVIDTPGHTCGSICLYCEQEKMLFSGDTLFRGSWGRIDLPTSNFEDIISSITTKLMELPDNTIVYPGHRKVYINRRGKAYLYGDETKRMGVNCKNKLRLALSNIAKNLSMYLYTISNFFACFPSNTCFFLHLQ